MVSDHILKIVIEAEDRATAALERIEAIMKRLGLVGTESFSKASGGSTKFSESVLKANSPLDSVQKHLKTIGVTGVQSFNQLSVSERKTLLEMSSLSNEAREVMQRLNEVGVNGRNTWNQLSQSQQKALTSMNSLSQSTVKVMDNFSRFGMNATSAATALKQLKMDSSFSTNLEQAKVKVSSLGVDINSTKGKILTLGSAAKESISTKFGGAITSAKEKLSSLKGSISSASTNMKTLNQSTQSAGSGMGFLRSAASMTVGMIGYDLVNSIMEASRESINARGNFEAFGKRLGMSSSELKSFSSQCDKLQSGFKKVDMNAVGASALELGVKLGVPKSQMADLTKMTAVMSSAFVKEGRTQEDAILAVSDAMDGQFRRLQEIGITQDKLKQNGWNGNLQDTKSLMDAINKTMDDMGFTETAQGIYTLDDAYQALTVSGGRLLADILIPITPIITGIIDGIINFSDSLKGLPGEAKIILIGAAIAGLAVVIQTSLIPAISAAAGTFLTTVDTVIIPALTGISIAGAPLWVVILAITGIAVAVYELGKAFDWWHDLDSMFAAFTSGWNRICSAVSENKALQEAFDILKYAIYAVQQALEPLLGSFQGCAGEFNIVGWIIHGVVIPAIEVLSVVIRYVAYGIIWAVSACQQFYSALEYLWGCIQNTISFFQWLYDCIVNIPTAAQNMITGIITWFSQLPGLVWGWIVNTATFILNGMLVWINYGRAKAQAFINGVIGFIKNLPGRVYTYIVNTASRILSGAASWVSNARSKASAMVSSVINSIAGLPGSVYQEFLNIGNRIVQAGQNVIAKAKQFGANLKNAVLNALGIHSPGIIQEKIATEFANIPGRIIETGKSVYDSAKEYGSRILDGFNSNDMSALDVAPSMDMESSDIPTPSVGSAVIGAEIDTEGVEGGMLNTSSIVTSGLTNMLLSEQNTMASMVADVNSNVGIIQSREQTSLDAMTIHLDKSMFSMINTTKSGLKSVTDTTKINLTNMQNSTTKVTTQMVKAWDSMKTNIINVATKIQSGSYAKFKSLHNTIKSFYSQIQSASFGSLAAGPGPGSSGNSRNVFRMPVSKSTVQSGSGVNFQKRVADTIAKVYAVTGLQAVPVSVNGEELYASSNVDGIANTHINKIMNTAYKWPLKNPKFLGATLPLNYKVGDLKNGKSGKDVLRGLDFETVMNAIWAAHGGWGYSFYYDSRMSPAQAFHGSSFNCYDGAQMVVAIAQMMDKSAYMVHGSWNGIGHMGAMVDGKLFDTTQRTNRGVWRGSSGVHFGPAPSDPFKNLENAISNLRTDINTGETFDVTTGKSVESSELKISGEATLNVNVNGLPDNVDTDTVVNVFRTLLNDKKFLKELVNNKDFQLLDNKAKNTFDLRNRRARGI